MTKNNLKQSRFNDIALLSFFPVVMLYMLLQFSGYRFPIIGIYVRVAFIYSAIVSFKYISRSIACQFLVIYILYCVFSFVFVIDSDIKISGYFWDLLNFVLPMFAFFIGSNYRLTDNRFYNWFLYSTFFCFGLGLIFYFFSPNWYVEKISAISYEILGTELSDLSQLHAKTRFSSFMYGPYPIQYFGIPALSIFLLYVYKIKNPTLYKKILIAISLFVLILSIILCQQRAAWGYMMVLFAFYLLVSKGRGKIIGGLLIVGIIVAVFVGVGASNNSIIGPALEERMNEMSFTKAMSGRSNQYLALWNNWSNPFLGQGMGSGGAIARIAGLPGASDAGYMKILYENGFVGFLLFLFIIIPTLVKMFKNIKNYYIEIHIILFFLIAMLGSNALCISLYYGIIFWYAMGRVWNTNYKANNVIKKI